MTRKQYIRTVIKVAGWMLAIFIILAVILIRIDAYVFSIGRHGIVQPGQAPMADCILVPGALVYSNREVSPMLGDRLDVAIELYEAGISDRILVSGDNRTEDYNEVQAMWLYLVERDVPEEHIVRDYAGLDTYNTIYRARDVFLVETCVIVTQEFHLVRALYIAEQLGLDAKGVDSSRRPYSYVYYRLREVLARTKAYLECEWLNTKPVHLGPVIPIDGG